MLTQCDVHTHSFTLHCTCVHKQIICVHKQINNMTVYTDSLDNYSGNVRAGLALAVYSSLTKTCMHMYVRPFNLTTLTGP